MSAPREQRLALPQLTLAAREWPGSGPKVLALHGWLDNAASFDPLLPLLPDVHAVALDLPGHGHSDHRPKGAWYHLVDNLSDILGALDALGWERVILLGHSMGAALASLAAAVLQERVAALWLIEGLGPLATAEAELPALMRRALDGRVRSAEKQLRLFETVDEAVATRLAATPMAEHAARRLVERGLRAVEGGWTWSSDPRLMLASPLRASEGQVEACLSAIACPSLLLTASDVPPYFPTDLVERRMARVPNLKRQVITGRHHVHMDDPGSVAAAIAAFRSEHAG
jgi:pimeloyl-ACP methyl ester carboxylesterase